MQKQCSRCREMKDLSLFASDVTKADGRNNYCKECRKVYAANWRKANPNKVKEYYDNVQSKGLRRPREYSNIGVGNKKYIKESKELKGKCDYCGYSKYTEVLQYHHKDPASKSFEIAHVGARDRELLVNEIAKCLLLCPTCHAEEHLGGKNKKNSVAYRGKF